MLTRNLQEILFKYFFLSNKPLPNINLIKNNYIKWCNLHIKCSCCKKFIEKKYFCESCKIYYYCKDCFEEYTNLCFKCNIKCCFLCKINRYNYCGCKTCR